MKRITLALLGLLLPVSLLVVVGSAAPASATPGCVTKWEYENVGRGMTQAAVRDRFDTAGYELDRWARYRYDDDSYDADRDDWFAAEPSWDDEFEWDNWYASEPQYSDYRYYALDTVRSYKKCRRFDGGRGRIGINFDNYYHAASGMRLYKKVRYNPWTLVGSMGYARSVPK
jgi:hypothetical protein